MQPHPSLLHLNSNSKQAGNSDQDALEGMGQHLQYVKAMQVRLSHTNPALSKSNTAAN